MIAASGKAAAIGRLIGWAAVAASLGFIGFQLWRDAPWQLAEAHLQPLAATIAVGVLLYGLAGFLLSGAWHQLLGAGESGASIRCHHAVYGRTQIAKYLPGNVFHLVGRQALGRRLGHGHARLAMASLLEVVLLVLIAGGLSLPIVWRWLDHGLLYGLASVGLLLVLVSTRWKIASPSRLKTMLAMTPQLLRAASLYAAFFFAVAAILWLLCQSLAEPGRHAIDLATMVSAVALAWLAGFATPGSSAGIGVREAVLIAALEGTLGASASTLIALALRLVSVGGDVMFLGLSIALAPAASWSKSMKPG